MESAKEDLLAKLNACAPGDILVASWEMGDGSRGGRKFEKDSHGLWSYAWSGPDGTVYWSVGNHPSAVAYVHYDDMWAII